MNQKRKMNDTVDRIWRQVVGILLVVVLGGGLWWTGGRFARLTWIDSSVRAAIQGERLPKGESAQKKGDLPGERGPSEEKEKARAIAIRALEVEAAGMVRSAAAGSHFDELRAKVAQEGTIPVLIRLRAGFEVERESLGEEAAEAQLFLSSACESIKPAWRRYAARQRCWIFRRTGPALR